MHPAHNMDRPERRGVSRGSVLSEAKAKVSTIDLADRLCGPGQMRRAGQKWTARCPLPDHDDKSPSFVVYPESDSWFCYGCLRGGDVIELARHAWAYDKSEVVTAAGMLLLEFGQPIPERPRSWYAKQLRQRPVRDAVEQVALRHIQRRLYRLFAPHIERIEDEGERQKEKSEVWHELRGVAALIVAGRRSA